MSSETKREIAKLEDRRMCLEAAAEGAAKAAQVLEDAVLTGLDGDHEAAIRNAAEDVRGLRDELEDAAGALSDEIEAAVGDA
jgi:hypothetical protein